MQINEFAKAVHENAVAHGWYDSGVTFPEVAVMVHAEISEAVEEYREGNPLFYGLCSLPKDGENAAAPAKPSGIAVELCDAVMRIFDYLAYLDVDIEAVLKAKYEYDTGRPYRHGGKKL